MFKTDVDCTIVWSLLPSEKSSHLCPPLPSLLLLPPFLFLKPPLQEGKLPWRPFGWPCQGNDSSSNFKAPKLQETNPNQAKRATAGSKEKVGSKTSREDVQGPECPEAQEKGDLPLDAKNTGSGSPSPSLQGTPQATRLARPAHPPPGKSSAPPPPADLLHIWTAPAAAR